MRQCIKQKRNITLLTPSVCMFLYVLVHQKLRNFEGIDFFFKRSYPLYSNIPIFNFAVRWVMLYKQIIFFPSF